ncbi:MAG: sigma-54-dependent Fis family transcriptional regulator [Candidatus Schekmanbacteria bacterium]|nr:sigma-54-dependent Fis family transcriptional regulator [Candidatus Schekmanbacteria bacterium]
MKNRILIVDDEREICRTLSDILQDEGYETLTIGSGEEALPLVEAEGLDLVILDIWLPGIDGLEVLRQIKQIKPDLDVVMISGHGNIDTAVKATKLGAYDFIEKPLSLEKILLVVSHALDKQSLEQENKRLKQRIEKDSEILGNSDAIMRIKGQIALAAPSEGWALICGENGTGKELIARSLHRQSQRSRGPFLEVNCAAIPEELIESELFGHEKGAFTGATGARRGKFELADGGTLFLDEIGDMSLKTQAKVLRVLEEQAFVRVGGDKKIHVNVRLIAASNKDLPQEIAAGRFREDLYYRLHVIPFQAPPMRERKEDIPLLINHFLQQFSTQNNKRLKKFSPSALQCLTWYAWPGNVRELKNLVERLVIMTPHDLIEPSDLPASVHQTPPDDHAVVSFKDARVEFEKAFLAGQLEKNNGNISKTAQQLKLERSHLHRKLKSLGLVGKDADA